MTGFKVFNVGANIEEIEREIDEILRKAELEKMRIIEAARRRAVEILERPFTLEDARTLANEIIAKAEKEAEEIARDAEKRAGEMKHIDGKTLEEIVDVIVRLVTGVD